MVALETLSSGDEAVAAVESGALPGAGGGPLSPEHLAALEEARSRRRPIDRAIGVAGFNAWGTAVFAALSLPFALVDVTSLLACLCLSVIAYHEFKGRRLLRSLDARAPRLLGFNQLAFAVLLIAYGAWNIYLGQTQPGQYAAVIAAEPAAADMLGSLDQLEKDLSLLIYGSLIVLALVFQGGMALYYFRRARCLRAYVNDTPAWILELQRATAGAAVSGRR